MEMLRGGWLQLGNNSEMIRVSSRLISCLASIADCVEILQVTFRDASGTFSISDSGLPDCAHLIPRAPQFPTVIDWFILVKLLFHYFIISVCVCVCVCASGLNGLVWISELLIDNAWKIFEILQRLFGSMGHSGALKRALQILVENAPPSFVQRHLLSPLTNWNSQLVFMN